VAWWLLRALAREDRQTQYYEHRRWGWVYALSTSGNPEVRPSTRPYAFSSNDSYKTWIVQ